MKLLKQIEPIQHRILGGNLLAIDPASGGTSDPGYAIFKGCRLVESGTIELDNRASIQERLHELFQILNTEFDTPDVLAIERIRGKFAHEYLKWSVGVTIAGICSEHVLEVPPSVWKQYAPINYQKSDEEDAIWIGTSVIELAGES